MEYIITTIVSNAIFIIVSLIAIYWLIILALIYLGNMTLEEAKKCISTKAYQVYTFLDEWAKKRQNESICYLVTIGSNGYMICADCVGAYFTKLGEYFKIWYFDNAFYSSANILTYQFIVYDQINMNFPRKRIINICRRIGEQALVTYWHENNIYNRIENFVAADWQADTLYIHYAINNEGFKEIAEIRKKSL